MTTKDEPLKRYYNSDKKKRGNRQRDWRLKIRQRLSAYLGS